MKFPGLCHVESLLVFAILVQSFAIIVVYEGTLQPEKAAPELANSDADEKAARGDVKAIVYTTQTSTPPEGKTKPADNFERTVRHTTPNPGGLILSSSFSYRQDPREVNRRKPLPHIFPTFENMYHFHTTVHQHDLHAIIFHDDFSFNQTFVKKHTTEYIKFVRVEAPTFDRGEPVISPNDFRYVVFNRWLRENSERDDENGRVAVNGIEYGWYMIADLDVFFQRNPFPKLDQYAQLQSLTFFGSFDGGTWENENMRLQRRLFRKWYVNI